MKTNKKLITLTICKNVVKYFVAVALLVHLSPCLGGENRTK